MIITCQESVLYPNLGSTKSALQNKIGQPKPKGTNEKPGHHIFSDKM